ncbi:endonuclease/exonuclease/phosphatase family protein [Pedosphaera parvula]|nr:endonuclease/exonuclease/phosphatase family protein [Pedosphaera parvula]
MNLRKHIFHTALIFCGFFVLLTNLQAESTNTFRVMTYNIHHGEGLDKQVDLQRIADLIKQEKADIVALQEVDRNTERTGKRDFPAEFTRLTGMSCVFSNNWPVQGGEYGTAILTRFPITKREHSLLKMVGSKEQRGLLQAHVKMGDREVVVMNTHVDHRKTDEERLESIMEFATVIKKKAELPVIFCGDFNDVPGSPTYEQMSALLDDSWKLIGEGEGWTIPAEKPRRRIDYIWISKKGPIIPLRAWVPASEASDHRPLVVEFQLPTGK